MPNKIPRRLVALSSSAIAAIYFAGLLSTRVAAESMSATASVETTPISTVVSSSSATPTSAPTVVVGATATATTAPTATTATTATTASTVSSAASSTGYADGTYTGTGSGRYGSVTVSLTTSGGKIASVQITKVSTTFPVSQIASLPAQVVQRQSATVNAVTGATASSQAFKQAVQQALVQAAAATSAQVNA